MIKKDIELVRYSEYWDSKWYTSQYKDVADAKVDPLDHFCSRGYRENRNPSIKFDTKRYRALYDVGQDNPLVHYEKVGKYKGIIPPVTDYCIIKNSKLFKKTWYRIKYLKKIRVDPITHYLEIGWKKGNNPSRKFDGNEYLNRNKGVRDAGQCPLVHYERNGRIEGRAIYPLKRPEYREKGLIWNLVQRVNACFFGFFMPSEIRNTKILVILHIFYPESWKEIKCYLNNLQIYEYDLIVTYSHKVDITNIVDDIKAFKSGVRIYSYDNKGFDIGPFVDVLQRVDIGNYYAVIKLHSKGIRRPALYMYGHYYEYKDWFTVLYRGVLGLLNAHLSIRKIYRPDVGIVAPEELIVQDPIHKQNFTMEAANENNFPFYPNYHFIAGTCMVFDAKVIQKFKNFHFTIEDFAETTRGEFSFAHFVERALCIIAEDMGYKTVGNYVFRIGAISEKIKVYKNKKYSALNLLNDSRFIIDDNFFYRVLENQPIEKYQVERIRLGDIQRFFEGKYYTLDSCAPYRYLLGYHNEYYKYSEFHKNNDLPLMTKKRFDDLIESIDENGFDRKSLPIINQDNVIQDGQHRSCYLLYKYGPDYEVDVLKIWYKNRRRKKEYYREYRKGFSVS